MKKERCTRRVTDNISHAEHTERDTSTQRPQQPSLQEVQNPELEKRSEETAHRLRRAAAYGLIALEREEVERLVEKKKIGFPQPFPERIELWLPPTADADLRRRVAAQSHT